MSRRPTAGAPRFSNHNAAVDPTAAPHLSASCYKAHPHSRLTRRPTHSNTPLISTEFVVPHFRGKLLSCRDVADRRPSWRSRHRESRDRRYLCSQTRRISRDPHSFAGHDKRRDLARFCRRSARRRSFRQRYDHEAFNRRRFHLERRCSDERSRQTVLEQSSSRCA